MGAVYNRTKGGVKNRFDDRFRVQYNRLAYGFVYFIWHVVSGVGCPTPVHYELLAGYASQCAVCLVVRHHQRELANDLSPAGVAENSKFVPCEWPVGVHTYFLSV